VALHLLQQDPRIKLPGLYTAVNQKYNRVSMLLKVQVWKDL
jgi:hypothetical protein